MNAVSPADHADPVNQSIVPWGRRLDEYAAFFGLQGEPAGWPAILDVGAGPSSFTAEATRRGGRVTAVDPLYRLGGDTIRRLQAEARPAMRRRLEGVGPRFVWDFYGSPEAVLCRREEALALFLEDYDWGRACGRYREAALPALPFARRQFGLALVSHLLFLYGHLLDEDFHVEALIELARVAPEVRVYPLADVAGRRSPLVEPVIQRLAAAGLTAREVPVAFAFQPGAGTMLQVTG